MEYYWAIKKRWISINFWAQEAGYKEYVLYVKSYDRPKLSMVIKIRCLGLIKMFDGDLTAQSCNETFLNEGNKM